ncbi:MAG: hypothetical protein EON59_17590 [Alphaproteobacteria bacterium]|nr:MAG: hypothetical protein EON59_17590 [Alphaproteobacteria bacterium]
MISRKSPPRRLFTNEVESEVTVDQDPPGLGSGRFQQSVAIRRSCCGIQASVNVVDADVVAHPDGRPVLCRMGGDKERRASPAFGALVEEDARQEAMEQGVIAMMDGVSNSEQQRRVAVIKPREEGLGRVR